MRITEAEACVMEAVWSAGPAGLSAADLLAQLCPAHAWSESTARTLIHRLMLKGALRSTRVPGGGAVYAPTVTREAWLAAEGHGLVDRLFGGELATMVALLTRERRPPADDLARLRRLVAELDASEDD
jgi:BlaI family penicillinase repressor